jgi:cAMP-dependent protein kinase regulator/CRP/FNR family cyclic AMP-dependent transcriptional regulator/cGMP-dependent protein kinase 2
VAKPSSTVKLLSGVPIFSELSPKELAAIARAAKEITHREGSVLAREGESGIGFFLISDGTAKVTVAGRTRTTLKPGDFFGEIGLLSGTVRNATVRATAPSEVLELDAEGFRDLIESSQATKERVQSGMEQRLAQSGPTT